jgi:chromosome segregation ATPase
MLKALEEVNEEHSQLSAQFESIQIDSENKFQEMEDVQQECEELEMEIARNNKLQAAKREESTELKKRHNELKDQLATVSLALQEAQAEHEALRSRIVSSPERRKRQLRDSNAALEYERKEAKALEEKMQEIKTKIMHVTQAIKDVPEVTDMVEEAVEGAKKKICVEEQRDTTRVDKDAILKKKAAILEDVEEAQGSLHRMEEKLAHMRKQTKVKMNAAHEALEQANAQLVEVEQDHMDGMARVEAGEFEVKAMEASIEREREKTLAEIKAMIADYHEMERTVLQQNAKLMGAIGVN